MSDASPPLEDEERSLIAGDHPVHEEPVVAHQNQHSSELIDQELL
eukprot:CAMPEP_0185762996 /NCGR_PEP_ID=MMETSP1174-20130828/21954_1 /TAXON_ID=35687 /ORGANISM="Dictyocha speculum, Strain CCMP1381" /LENGTH=44 /DNA_ID= /DNA_START= /DNA_END= /DNA_ORIENTATION=